MGKYKFIFNPISKQLDLVNNDEDTPVIPTGSTTGIVIIDKVNTYSLLPSASSCTGNCYLVLNDQGTAWLPGSLGGTFYGKGIYYSNGFTWTLTGSVPYQATQQETNIGVSDSAFVTPLKLKNYTGFTQYQKIINLTTTGNTGSATFLNDFLNVPTYTLAGLGGQTQLNGNGFVRINGTTLSYLTGTTNQFVKADGSLDSSVYLTSAITSFNGLTNPTQSFTNDTNVIITSTGSTHVIGWSGTLNDNRITSASNWNTAFNNRIINFTTTGNTGSASFNSGNLNIPTYTLSGLGGQPQLNGNGFIRINGTTLSYLTGTTNQFIKADGSLDNNTYLTSNQSITFTSSGDITGTTTGSVSLTPTLNLSTISQSSSGNFVKVSLDNKGRVTGNTSVLSSDITNVLGYVPYNSTNPNGYITGNTNIVLSGVISGSGTTGITTTFTSGSTGNGKVVLATGGTVTTLTVTDDILMTSPSFNNSYLGNKMALNSFTGLISGGYLQVNSNPALFNISGGTGQIVDYSNTAIPKIINVSWNDFVGVVPTYLSTFDISYVLITSGGTVFQTSTFPSQLQRRNNIFIGRLSHSNRTSISFANAIPDIVGDLGNNLYDFYDALGQFNITGNVISTNGANLTFVKNAGTMFTRAYNYSLTPVAPNIVNVPASSTPASFAYRTQTGGTTSNVTVIDPTKYDVNGVVTTVPGGGGTATIQRVFLFPGGNIRIQYGQHTYTSLANAISGLNDENFIITSSLQNLSILIGYIVVTKNCTDLTDTTRAKIIKAARFDSGTDGGSLSTTTLQGAYNNSTTPEIVTDSVRGAFTLQRGSASDSDVVFEVSNGTGGTVSYITGQGNNFVNAITGNTFVKIGGTGSQFLKADGSVDSNTYLTSNQSITFTSSGDITGTTTGSVSLTPTLNLTTVNQSSTGNFVKIALDSKGRVTGNTAVVSSDIINALGYTPSSGSSTYVGTANRIIVSSGGTIDIASNYIGQSSINTLGTITGGTWNGSSITDTYISSSSNWNTAYNNRISNFTTTGDTGSASFVGNVLNIPTYTLAGLSGQTQLNGNGFVKVNGTTVSYDNSTYLSQALTSLNGLTGTTQTFVNDTNIIVTSTGSTHVIGWNGTLTDDRISSATTWNNKQNALNGNGFIRITGSTIGYLTGTSSQFVKADGSLDSNTYLSSASLSNYLPLSGGTLTGSLTGVAFNVTNSSTTGQPSFITLTNSSSDSLSIRYTEELISNIVADTWQFRLGGVTSRRFALTYFDTFEYFGTTGTTISNSSVRIPLTTSSTNTTTGALVVAGGLGVGGALNLGTALSVTNGGTAQNTYATGDMLFASATDTLSKRTIGSTGQVLAVAAGVPTWTSLSGLSVSNIWSVEFAYKYTVSSSTPFYRVLADTGPSKYTIPKNCTVESASFAWGVAPSGGTYRFWYSINGGTWTLFNTATIASGTGDGTLTPSSTISLSAGNTIQFYYVAAGLSGTSLSFNIIFKS